MDLMAAPLTKAPELRTTQQGFAAIEHEHPGFASVVSRDVYQNGFGLSGACVHACPCVFPVTQGTGSLCLCSPPLDVSFQCWGDRLRGRVLALLRRPSCGLGFWPGHSRLIVSGFPSDASDGGRLWKRQAHSGPSQKAPQELRYVVPQRLSDDCSYKYLFMLIPDRASCFVSGTRSSSPGTWWLYECFEVYQGEALLGSSADAIPRNFTGCRLSISEYVTKNGCNVNVQLEAMLSRPMQSRAAMAMAHRQELQYVTQFPPIPATSSVLR